MIVNIPESNLERSFMFKINKYLKKYIKRSFFNSQKKCRWKTPPLNTNKEFWCMVKTPPLNTNRVGKYRILSFFKKYFQMSKDDF